MSLFEERSNRLRQMLAQGFTPEELIDRLHQLLDQERANADANDARLAEALGKAIQIARGHNHTPVGHAIAEALVDLRRCYCPDLTDAST